jgi:hypothetical protein
MPSANLLTKVDDLLRGDHYYLDEADDCYFLWEYTARAGFAHSTTNNLILNLKKPMDRRGRSEWWYKEQAIVKCGDGLATAMRATWQLNNPLIVPAPPSKVRSNPLHDDRILQVAHRIGTALSLPVAELLENKTDREPQHATAQKRNIQALTENLQYRAPSLAAQPTGILLIDDVLTTGATFTACKSVIQASLPGMPVWGVFVARRVPEAEPEDVDYGDAPEDDDW